MWFVNTLISNIATVSQQMRPEIPSGVLLWLTIFSIIMFVLSFVLATYIIIVEYRNEKKQKSLTQTETRPEYNTDDTTVPVPVATQTPSDALPLTQEEELPHSISLLSAFEKVSLPDNNTQSPSESIPLPVKPVPSPLKPKPVPSRPKPIPLPIETPPAYSISNLQVEPSIAIPGDTVFVSFIITNNTTESGNHSVSLKVNGFEIYSNHIVLNPFESKALSFPIRAIEPGYWDIDVNNVLCKLHIVEDNR